MSSSNVGSDRFAIYQYQQLVSGGRVSLAAEDAHDSRSEASRRGHRTRKQRSRKDDVVMTRRAGDRTQDFARPRTPIAHRKRKSIVDIFGTLVAGTRDPCLPQDHDIETLKTMMTLTNYGRDYFIPSVFVLDKPGTHATALRHERILNSMRVAPSVHLGLYCVMAADRALRLQRRIESSACEDPKHMLGSDEDLTAVKGLLYRYMIDKIQNNGTVDVSMIEAIFSYVGAEIMVGNWDEAQRHRQQIKLLARQAGLLGTQPWVASTWIPLYDAFCAMGLLSTPLFSLAWAETDYASQMLSRLLPARSTQMADAGVGFLDVAGLSMEMRDVIRLTWALCLLCEVKLVHGIDVKDDEVLRRLALQIIHALLRYGARAFRDGGNSSPEEVFAGLAILTLIRTTVVSLAAGTGLARTITGKAVYAQHNLGVNWCDCRPDDAAAKFALWGLFLYRLGSEEQSEVTQVDNNIVEVARFLGTTSWGQVSSILNTFLWVPSTLDQRAHLAWTSLRIAARSSSPPSGQSDFKLTSKTANAVKETPKTSSSNASAKTKHASEPAPKRRVKGAARTMRVQRGAIGKAQAGRREQSYVTIAPKISSNTAHGSASAPDHAITPDDTALPIGLMTPEVLTGAIESVPSQEYSDRVHDYDVQTSMPSLRSMSGSAGQSTAQGSQFMPDAGITMVLNPHDVQDMPNDPSIQFPWHTGQMFPRASTAFPYNAPCQDSDGVYHDTMLSHLDMFDLGRGRLSHGQPIVDGMNPSESTMSPMILHKTQDLFHPAASEAGHDSRTG